MAEIGHRYLTIRRCLIGWFAAATLGVAGLAASWPAQAQSRTIQGEGTTREEMALLPPYCPHAAMYTRIYGSPEGRATWLARLGKDFNHIHHYCWALVALQRADRASTSPYERRGYLLAAERDVSYVINHSGRDFMLMPEMYLRRGQIRLRLDNERDAIEDFNQAISLRPDYSPPYVALAKLWDSQGKRAEARKILEEGLKHSPDSKYLRHAMSQLGQTSKTMRRDHVTGTQGEASNDSHSGSSDDK